MKMMTRLALFLLILVGASSCATMDKSECLQADWRMIGMEDGSAGRQLSYIGTRRKDCAEHGVTPNLEQYNIGRNEGLKQFCTYQNGYRHGSNGNSNTDVCQGGLQGAYVDGYNKGSEVYGMTKEINQMTSQLRSKESELAGLDEDIRVAESKLISRAGSQAARISQLDHYNHLKADRDSLANYLYNLDQDIAKKRQQRDALDAQYSR